MKTFRIYYERDHYDIVADEWRIRGIIEDERLTQIAPFSHYFYIGDELKAYFPLNCSVEDITNELKEQKGEWYSDNETKKGEIKVRDLDLTGRALNMLKACDIEYLEELTEFTTEDILGWRNVGKTTLKEIITVLYNHGLKLKG